MDAKEDWIKKRNDLLKRAEVITLLLKYEYGEQSEADTSGLLNDNGQSPSIFPIKGKNTNKQILWLFDNVFTKSVRLKEVSEKLAEYRGESVKIDNAVRTLRKDKKLVMVKYDDKQILSWWGKSSWVSGNDFAAEYKSDDIPDTDKSEVITT